MVKYYYAGSTRIAMRQGSTLSWLFGDHLGSTSAVANENGSAGPTQFYKPWGEKRPAGASSLPTTYRYTGQRQESSLGGTDGLYFYGARWLDPSLGRFTQPDTLVPGIDNPQRWDRFGYVLNNPLRYTDPSGHSPAGPCSPGDDCDTDQGGGNSEITGSGGDTDVGGCGGQGCDLGGNNDDDNSPDNGLTISSWEQPEWWDTNPKNPDYYILVVSFENFTGVFILDRYGGIYLGGGGNIGRSLGYPTVSLNGGYIGSGLDSTCPDQANTVAFLTQFTFTGSIGALGDVAVTWSPGAGKYVDHLSWEFGGLLPASLGVSGTYTFKVYDLGDLFGR